VASWKRIKAEYIAGGTSYRKLVDKYGVSRTTLERKAKEEKWPELRRQKDGATEAKIVESISDQEANKAIDIINVADLLLEKVIEVAGAISLDTKSIKELTSALKDLKEIKGYKSAKDLEEQNARIAKLQRDAERESDTADGIEIVFHAGSEAWSE